MIKPLIFITVAILGGATSAAAQTSPGEKSHDTWLIFPAEQNPE
jgi:hypothetical protein